MGNRFLVLCAVVMFICLTGVANAEQAKPTASDGKVPGKPFEYLQQQIDQLKGMLSDSQDSNTRIKVFDDRSQFLGFLLDVEAGENVRIFVPSLNKVFSTKDSGAQTEIFFEDTSCQGTPYIRGEHKYDVIAIGGKLYVGNLDTQKGVQVRSFSNGGSSCYRTPSDWWGNFLEPVEVFPFELPLAEPLRFE